MRRTAWLALLLLLPTGALAQTAAPDASGGHLLSYDVVRDRAGDARLALDVTRDDAGDVARSTRDLGVRHLDAGATRVDVHFLPAEGPGEYAVTLLVDGAPAGTARFTVAEAGGASRDVSWRVADEPTLLRLTVDAVNADGKAKSPGETLLTRATLEDANGLADVQRLAYVVVGDGAPVASGDVPFPANGTRADVEVAFARSPMPAGNYTLLLRALKPGGTVAEASRTFAIREAAPTAALRLPHVAPDEDRVVEGALVLSDRNGVDPATPLELRLYKGSTRVEPKGLSLGVGAWSPLPDADGAGRAAATLRLVVPNGTAPGAYRASAYSNGALLGSGAFDVLPLPRLAGASARGNDSLVLVLDLTAPAHVTAEAGGAVAALDAPAGQVEVPLPAAGAAASWTVTVRARADGPALDAASGEWRASRLALGVTPLRAPAAWRVDAGGASLAGAEARVTLVRWDGAVLSPRATFDGSVLRIDAPREAGRYAASLALALPDGTRANATWTLDVAPWMRVALGEPVVSEREARIPVANEGGVDVRALLAEVEGARVVALETPSGRVEPAFAGGRARFDAALPVDGNATLVVALPSGPLPAGDHTARVRVLALGARP